MAGSDEAGQDMEAGRENRSEIRTLLVAITGDPDGYAEDFVFGVHIDGGYLLTKPSEYPSRGIDGINTTGSIQSSDSQLMTGPILAGNGLVARGLNGVVGYVHSAPRDKNIETDASAGLLGIGDGEHVGVIGRGVDGVVGISASNSKSGVYGFNAQTSGPAFGVFGRCPSPEGTGVAGQSDAGVGVNGSSLRNDGVVGITDATHRSGVYGYSSVGEGVSYGVFGRSRSPDSAGVAGANESKGDAVRGASRKGVGVRGTSDSNDGVVGLTNIAGKSGVYGENKSERRSIFDPVPTAGHGTINVFGVTGCANAAEGIGVQGLSDHGIGVFGKAGNYGAVFKGGRAPLRLLPGSGSGAPSVGHHEVGEFYVDAAGDLFFCKQKGTPGSWAKIA